MIVMGGKLRRNIFAALTVPAGLFAFDALFGEGRPLGLRIVCDASGAMEPTFMPGECVLVAPAFGEIRRGNILAYRDPDKDAPPRLSRVVGLPGEGVELRDGALAIVDARISRLSRVSGLTSPKLVKLESLPPQDAVSPWIQSNSSQWSEIWPCRLSYEIFWLDGGERWSRRAVSARLGPGAYFLAPDNRDGARPDIVGGSAVTGRLIAIVWSSDRRRLFSAPNASPAGEGKSADWGRPRSSC